MITFIVMTLASSLIYFNAYFHSINTSPDKPKADLINEYCSDSERNELIKEKYGSIGGCISSLSSQEMVRLQGEMNAYQRANDVTSRMDRAFNQPQTNCTTSYINGTAYTNCR